MWVTEILNLLSSELYSLYWYFMSYMLTLWTQLWELRKEDKAKTWEILVQRLKGIMQFLWGLEVYSHNHIAVLCVIEDAVDRPTIFAIVLMLYSEIALPCPKQHASVFRTSCNSSPMLEGPSSLNVVTITSNVVELHWNCNYRDL